MISTALSLNIAMIYQYFFLPINTVSIHNLVEEPALMAQLVAGSNLAGSATFFCGY